ncbi:MAG: hypothetical protein ACI934_001350 [Pseudohongiellaceae bacterium]|jgi:hypothetical protein|tara:strand:+ start:816 stop:968 length:153 start_codon:yes stop_codon:yes gene_type:complete
MNPGMTGNDFPSPVLRQLEGSLSPVDFSQLLLDDGLLAQLKEPRYEIVEP